IYNFKINFVSFNQGVIDNLEVISNFINKIKKEQGIEINYSDYNVQNVTNIYEKLQRQNSISIVLPYKHLQQSYSINEIDSYVGLINGKELIKSLEDVIGVIFDENIRLHEIKSKVNEGIKNTSSSDKDSSMFYFYNNGITFICDQVNLSPSNLTVRLDGASIVNGCQTVTSLYENHTKKELQEDVDLLVRITKISDYDERAKITQFLNSQNPIKESYFISNHTIVRDLQTKLFESNYYLERQINESSYKEQYVDSSIKNGKKIIKLDDVIQYYCGYHLDKFAATAKRNKNILFNNENIEEILSDITPDKVIESYETYLKVAEVITAYRRQRRNKENEEFAKLMGIDKKELDNSEEKYLFVNTADILILNTCKFLKLKDPSSDVEKNIVNAVKIIRDIIQNDQELKAMPPAGLTKNQLVYTKISEYMK
ncbi:AIPR family protein, partial [Enterococcus hirae]